MQNTLKYHDSTISIMVYISDLRFVDDIYLIAGSSDELQKLTDSLAKSVSRYRMEIIYENIKNLVNDPDPNKVNSNNLTINIYGKKNKNNNIVYIYWGYNPTGIH